MPAVQRWAAWRRCKSTAASTASWARRCGAPSSEWTATFYSPSFGLRGPCRRSSCSPPWRRSPRLQCTPSAPRSGPRAPSARLWVYGSAIALMPRSKTLLRCVELAWGCQASQPGWSLGASSLCERLNLPARHCSGHLAAAQGSGHERWDVFHMDDGTSSAPPSTWELICLWLSPATPCIARCASSAVTASVRARFGAVLPGARPLVAAACTAGAACRSAVHQTGGPLLQRDCNLTRCPALHCSHLQAGALQVAGQEAGGRGSAS